MGILILSFVCLFPHKIPLKYTFCEDESGGTMSYFDNKTNTTISFYSEDFRHIRFWDWQSLKIDELIGNVVGETVVFSGVLNHSREILYFYNTRERELKLIDNVTNWGCCPIGWWAITDKPLYAEFGLKYFYIGCGNYNIRFEILDDKEDGY